MQTLRERMDELCLWFDVGGEPACAEVRALLDLTILDGVGLVAMDAKAGARVLFRENDHAKFEDIGGTEQDQYSRHLKHILTTCGIIVPDEVVDAAIHTDKDGIPQSFFRRTGRMDPLVEPYALDNLDDSYTITITHKPSESPNGCTGKSGLHPQGKGE